MRNPNQPYDTNNYRPLQVREDPYDLSSRSVKPKSTKAQKVNPYDLHQVSGLVRLAEVATNSLN
jgi:hypothetical protein